MVRRIGRQPIDTGSIPVFTANKRICRCSNAVDLGDIFRQASITEPFYMLVGFYTDSNFDNDDIYLLHFNQNEWHQFFMDVDQFEDKFRGALDAVTNNKEDDDKWKILMNDCKNYWKEHTPNIKDLLFLITILKKLLIFQKTIFLINVIVKKLKIVGYLYLLEILESLLGGKMEQD